MNNFPWKINLKNLGFTPLLASLILFQTSASAFPIYAQQAYANPREANGRIACANCHLAQKPVEIETPQAVLPNTVFEAVVKIPYDLNSKQILGSGAKGGNCRTGIVDTATAAITAQAAVSCDHHSRAAIAAVATTNR